MAEMDEVFRALADPSRRLLLDSLNARNGQSLRDLCAGLSMARQSVSKHLAVLEDANLITTVWRGREKLHYLNAEPINAIADRWINQYDRARVQTLADLKTALETEPMSAAPNSSTRPTSAPHRNGCGRRSPTRRSPVATWATRWCRTSKRARRTSGPNGDWRSSTRIRSSSSRTRIAGSPSRSTPSYPNSPRWVSTRRSSPRLRPSADRRCRSTSKPSTTTR